jgi:TetR/AcrR family transcriptional repressor of nem operon
MARPKEFDQAEALESAMLLFWEKGYAATSIQDLVERIGINRASLYGTYREKRSLFLQALRLYQSQEPYRRLLEQARGGSPKRALQKFFRETIQSFATVPALRRRGCLMQNTALELAPHDAAVREIVREDFQQVIAIFRQVLRLAQEQGEIFGPDRELDDLAHFLFANLSALRLLAKAGLNEATLKAVGRIALRSLN